MNRLRFRSGQAIFACSTQSVLHQRVDIIGSEGRIEIVDWKTGAPPSSAADLELKQFQLALYRFAYAEREGIDPEGIDAVYPVRRFGQPASPD